MWGGEAECGVVVAGGGCSSSAKPSSQFPPETAPAGAMMPVCRRVTASSASRPLRQGTQTSAKAGPWPWGVTAGFSLPKGRPRAPPYPCSEGGVLPAPPPVPFLLESCAGSPFDPTVLALGRMSELQPHLPPAPRHPPAFSGVLRIVGALDRARWHPGDRPGFWEF